MPEQFTSGRWLAYSALLIATFQTVLTSSVIAIMIPSIHDELQLSNTATVWVLGAFVLEYGVLMIAGGRLGDLYGTKLIFLIALAVYLLGSVLALFSHNGTMLITASGLQGCAAALAIPQVLGSIPSLFPPDERAKAYGYYSTTTGLALAIAPIMGGAILAFNVFGLGWRALYLFGILLCSFAVITAWKILPPSRKKEGSVDYTGVVLLSLGLLAFLCSFTIAQAHGWNWIAYAFLASSIPLSYAFVWWQKKRVNAEKDPLLDLKLFKSRPFISALITAISYLITYQALLFVISTYLQKGSNFTPLHTGIIMTPFAFASMASAYFSARLTAKLGSRVVMLGGFFVLLGLVCALLINHYHWNGWLFALALTFVGFGHSLIVPANFSLGLKEVPTSQAGSAGAVLNTAQRIGQSIGAAVVGGLFLSLSGNGHREALDISLLVLFGSTALIFVGAAIMPKNQHRETIKQ